MNTGTSQRGRTMGIRGPFETGQLEGRFWQNHRPWKVAVRHNTLPERMNSNRQCWVLPGGGLYQRPSMQTAPVHSAQGSSQRCVNNHYSGTPIWLYPKISSGERWSCSGRELQRWEMAIISWTVLIVVRRPRNRSRRSSKAWMIAWVRFSPLTLATSRASCSAREFRILKATFYSSHGMYWDYNKIYTLDQICQSQDLPQILNSHNPMADYSDARRWNQLKAQRAIVINHFQLSASGFQLLCNAADGVFSVESGLAWQVPAKFLPWLCNKRGRFDYRSNQEWSQIEYCKKNSMLHWPAESTLIVFRLNHLTDNDVFIKRAIQLNKCHIDILS